MDPILVSFLAIGALFFFVVVVSYNTLVRRANAVDQAQGAIAAQLKARFDLIPALVDATKAHMNHERSLLEDLTRMRTSPISSKLPPEQLDAIDRESAKALRGIMVAVENYPKLTTDTSFQQLQRSLHTVEMELAAARRAFNSAVTDLNNSVDSFPSSLFALTFGFKRRETFQVTAEESARPDVGKLFKDAS